MSQVTLNVPDISCAHCEKTVVGALQGQTGVNSVQVNIPGKTVYLDYDESALSLDQVKSILDDEGYPVASVKEGAPAETTRRNFIPLSNN